MALVAAAALYPYIPGLDSGADAALDATLAAVESQLASWCGWPPIVTGGTPGSVSWDAATRTFYLDGPSEDEPRRIQLPVAPVTAIASIYDDPTWGYTGANHLVASGDYTLIEDTGEVWLNPDASWSWSRGRRNIRVVCTAGYAAATVAMAEAIKRQAAAAYQIQKGGAGRTRANGKEVSATYDLPPIRADVRHLLRQARCPSIWLS